MLSSRGRHRPKEVSRRRGPTTVLETAGPGHSPLAWAQLPVSSPSEPRIDLCRPLVPVKAGSGRGPWAVPGLQPSQKPPCLGLRVEENTPCHFPEKAGDCEVFINPKRGSSLQENSAFTEPSRSLVPTNCGIVVGPSPILPFIHLPQFSPNGKSIVG